MSYTGLSSSLKMIILKLSIDSICNQKDINIEAKHYYGNGTTPQEEIFGIQLAQSCAHQAFLLFSRNKLSLSEATFRLYKSIDFFNTNHFEIAMMCFFLRIKENYPEYFLNNTLKPEFLNELENNFKEINS